jgi:hypothetical protein
MRIALTVCGALCVVGCGAIASTVPEAGSDASDGSLSNDAKALEDAWVSTNDVATGTSTIQGNVTQAVMGSGGSDGYYYLAGSPPAGTIIAGRTVRLLDAHDTVQSTTTDANGAFTFANVAVPYSIAVAGPSGASGAIAYVGLSTLAPQLLGATSALASFHAPITVHIIPPQGSGLTYQAIAASSTGYPATMEATSIVNFAWNDVSTTTVTVYGFVHDAAFHYWYGTATVTVTDATPVTVDVPVQSIPTTNVTASGGQRFSMELVLPLGVRFGIATGLSPLTAIVPAVPTGLLDVEASANSGDDLGVTAGVQPIATSPTVLPLPTSSPVWTSPSLGDPTITQGEALAFQPATPNDDEFEVIGLSQVNGMQAQIVTKQSHISLPALAAIGLVFPAGPYYALLSAQGPGAFDAMVESGEVSDRLTGRFTGAEWFASASINTVTISP